jgi:hypothetical protein
VQEHLPAACLPVARAGRKAKSVTTAPAVAFAKAGQLTHIVRASNWHFLEQSSPFDFNIKTLEK